MGVGISSKYLDIRNEFHGIKSEYFISFELGAEPILKLDTFTK
jgi:hypothetical protein